MFTWSCFSARLIRISSSCAVHCSLTWASWRVTSSTNTFKYLRINMSHSNCGCTKNGKKRKMCIRKFVGPDPPAIIRVPLYFNYLFSWSLMFLSTLCSLCDSSDRFRCCLVGLDNFFSVLVLIEFGFTVSQSEIFRLKRPKNGLAISPKT